MTSDAALIIPHLSKELNLIGQPALPYTLENECKKKPKSTGDEVEHKIVFDNKLMLRSLTNVCFELVKQVKALGIDDDGVLDKVNFEKSKLEKQLKSSKSKIETYVNEITALKLANQQLQEKVENLEKKIKDYKISHQSLIQKNQTKEDVLKHVLKKNNTEIFNLHKTVWKQFNLVDKNYFPENFKLVQLNQPDFNKLWSKVNYSEPKTREDSLKKAVCMFQNNNKYLMEENFALKTILLSTLKEIHYAIKDLGVTLHLPETVIPTIEINNIFVNVEEFDHCYYDQILNKHLIIIKRLCELFDDASFTIAEDIFVCWTKIIEEF